MISTNQQSIAANEFHNWRGDQIVYVCSEVRMSTAWKYNWIIWQNNWFIQSYAEHIDIWLVQANKQSRWMLDVSDK